MFIVVVAFLLVLILGLIMFTDVVDNGSLNLKSLKSAAMNLLRSPSDRR